MIGYQSVMSCFSIRIKHMDCYIYGVTLLLKEYTFIYLSHIEALKGSWADEYQTKNIFVLDTYFFI